MMKFTSNTFGIVLFFFSQLIFSQKNVVHQDTFWVRYQGKVNINDKNTVVLELDERNYISPWRQQQFVARTTFERNLGNNWKADVGFAFVDQSLPQDPYVDITQNTLELRPHIGLSYEQKITEKLSIGHRYRMEFRFIEENLGKILYTNNRMRYQLGLRYMIHPKISVLAFDEIHLNIGKKIASNVFDQNRIGGSVVFYPNKNFALEMGYFNYYQQRVTGTDFYSRDILRFTLHHNINLKKKRN